MNNAKVDEFVAMVECARKIYWEEEDKYTTNRKRKRREEDTDSNYLPTLRREMQCMDAMMRAVPPQASQRRETRALQCFELE
jgi:hypothetical protein